MPQTPLTHPTAHALYKILNGQDAPTPNGLTPAWEVELVEAIKKQPNNLRMVEFKTRIKHRGDAQMIHAQIFLAHDPEPKMLTINKPNKAEKDFTSADYMSILTQMGYRFRLCELDDRIEVNKQPISDVIEAEIRTRCRDAGLRFVEIIRDCFITSAAENRYHPVKEYFSKLNWDGEDHISKLSEYFVDQDNLFPAAFRLWLIGAVAKMYEQSQNRMLVLEGPQNLGKSFFVSWLAQPLKDFHIEGAIEPDEKDHLLRLCHTFIWEVSEIGATTRRADVEALKNFLTMRQVTVRAPYGRNDIIKPALASFIGTVNNVGGFLNDPTGSRRFMSVNLISVDWDYAKSVNVDQVWAQAVALYHQGASWIPNAETLAIIQKVNGEYEMEDPLEDLIRKNFEIDIKRNDWFVSTLEIIELLHEGGWRGNNPRAEAALISTAAKKLGLRKGGLAVEDTFIRGYFGMTRRLQSS